MAIPLLLKGGNHWFDSVTRFSKVPLPLLWGLWSVHDLFRIGQGDVMSPLPWAVPKFMLLVKKITWDGETTAFESEFVEPDKKNTHCKGGNQSTRMDQ